MGVHLELKTVIVAKSCFDVDRTIARSLARPGGIRTRATALRVLCAVAVRTMR
jgi:hypothetical protein